MDPQQATLALTRLINGYQITQVVYVASTLGMKRIVLSWLLLAGLLIGPVTAMAQQVRVETRKAVQYGTHDGTALIGDLYLPEGNETRPAIIAVHGGGFQLGSRSIYQHMGPYLAARGYAVFSIDYRLTRDGNNTPGGGQ